jgi:hypothetical protein
VTFAVSIVELQTAVGTAVAFGVGLGVGASVGESDGAALGESDGAAEGESEAVAADAKPAWADADGSKVDETSDEGVVFPPQPTTAPTASSASTSAVRRISISRVTAERSPRRRRTA